MNGSTNWAPNSSRPVLLGGCMRKVRVRRAARPAARRRTRPAAASAPSASKRCMPPLSRQAAWSISALPGPVSKASMASHWPPGGTQVTLPMPPMFCTARLSCCVAEQQRVAPRRQRRALAAGGDVARAEIGDGGHAQTLGDDRRLGQLQRRTRVARARPGATPSGRARRPGRPATPACRSGQRRRAGERLAEQHVDLAHLVDAALLGIEQRVDALRAALVDRRLGVRQQAHAQRRRPSA